MKGKTRLLGLLVSVTCGLACSAGAGTPLEKSFTYQGRLDFGDGPVDGTCDFQFSLYDSVVGGNLLVGPIELSEIEVSEGLFAVTLDFSPFQWLNSEERYLEIAVGYPSGVGSFTTLSPRQRISPTPFAFRSLRADYASGAGRLMTLASGRSDPSEPLSNCAMLVGTVVRIHYWGFDDCSWSVELTIPQSGTIINLEVDGNDFYPSVYLSYADGRIYVARGNRSGIPPDYEHYYCTPPFGWTLLTEF